MTSVSTNSVSMLLTPSDASSSSFPPVICNEIDISDSGINGSIDQVVNKFQSAPSLTPAPRKNYEEHPPTEFHVVPSIVLKSPVYGHSKSVSVQQLKQDF